MLESATVIRIDAFEASLLIDEGNPEAAISLLHSAIERAGDGRERRVVLTAILGRALGEAGRHDEAIQANLSVVADADPHSQTRLALGAVHNIAWAYIDEGKFDAADGLLESFAASFRSVFGAGDRARTVWLHALIAAGRSQWLQAESRYLEAIEIFSQENVAVDVAFAALELSEIYARQKRHRELRSLVTRIAPIFASQQLRRESQAALAVFRRSVLEESVTVEVVRRTLRNLKSGSSRHLRLVDVKRTRGHGPASEQR
ncbi:MAG: hypothetical protein ABI609_01185 [Acidobacteriota bacterium]